jgi:hypothetical protein
LINSLATIAVCPGCQTQLGVPSDAPTGAQLTCPICQKLFAATPDCIRVLAMASVAPTRPATPPAAAVTMAPLSLPPDATIESEPVATAPPVEVEVDFDIGAISAMTPITSQPTVSWDPQLPGEEAAAPVAAPAVAAAEAKPIDTRRLAGDWSNILEQKLVPARAPAPPVPLASQATGEDDVSSPDFEHDEDDEVHAMDFDGVAPVGGPAAVNHDFDMSPAPRPRQRRSSPIGTLVGIVGGGGIGLLLAGYALLWLTDPPLDLFRMADWAPTAVLPETLLPQSLLPPSASSQWADEDATTDGAAVASEDPALAAKGQTAGDDASTETTAGLLADQSDDENAAADHETAAADIQTDPAVTPASASEPVATANPEAPIATPAAAMPLAAPTKWPSTPIVGDLVAPKFASLNDFTASIGNVDAAGRLFLGGDLANTESRRAMGQAYIQLCEVAERYTLTDPADYGPDLFTKQALAKAVLRRIAGNTKRRQDLNVVAARWWQHAKRTNDGLLLVGRVTDHTPRGQWTEHMLEIAVGDEIVKVPVLMDRVLFSTGAEAAVAGAIVANPREQLRGYDGDAPQVLIAGTAFDPALYANESTGEERVIDPLTL